MVHLIHTSTETAGYAANNNDFANDIDLRFFEFLVPLAFPSPTLSGFLNKNNTIGNIHLRQQSQGNIHRNARTLLPLYSLPLDLLN